MSLRHQAVGFALGLCAVYATVCVFRWSWLPLWDVAAWDPVSRVLLFMVGAATGALGAFVAECWGEWPGVRDGG